MEQQQISYEKVPARAPSKQMQCVIMVLTADAELARVSASHVDCHNETIHWQGIFKSYLSPGLKAAALLAYALWTDEMKPKMFTLKVLPQKVNREVTRVWTKVKTGK